MSKIESVVFDADLTLIDSFKGVHEIYCRAARKLGLSEPSQDALRNQWGKKVPDIIVGLFGENQRDRVYQVLSEVGDGYEHQLFAGVVDALRSIAGGGLSLGILSTTDKRFFRPHLERVGVWGLFDLVVGGEDTEVRKPDPAVFAVFLARYKPEELVYVGDALVDWEAARDAGLGLFLAVTTGHTSRKDFRSAGVPEIQILESIANVPKALGFGD
ncbi:HAD family hydrolase [Candidatus Collierbacteria bacterium]|nr:HAD family hydrolase [Candidatus Collierbacteria bacterium]